MLIFEKYAHWFIFLIFTIHKFSVWMWIRSVWGNCYCVNRMLFKLNILVEIENIRTVCFWCYFWKSCYIHSDASTKKTDDRVLHLPIDAEKTHPVCWISCSKTSRKNEFNDSMKNRNLPQLIFITSNDQQKNGWWCELSVHLVKRERKKDLIVYRCDTSFAQCLHLLCHINRWRQCNRTEKLTFVKLSISIYHSTAAAHACQ